MNTVMYHYVRNYDKLYPNFKFLKKKSFLNQIKNFENTLGVISKKSEIYKCPNKFLLTFDDGLKDHYEAAKILKKRGHIGIFFIPTFPYIKNKILDVHMIQLITSKMKSEDLMNELNFFLKKNNLKYIYENFVKKEFKKRIYTRDLDEIVKFKTFLNYEASPMIRKKIINYFSKKLNIRIKAKNFYLSKKNIIKMKKMGMIIGSHGFSHQIMSRLTLKQQNIELKSSKEYLEKMINSEVDFFCYPYGKSFTYNDRTFDLLKKNKFKLSFAAITRKTTKKDLSFNKYALPRHDTNFFIRS